MGKVIGGMAVSLDGFIHDREGIVARLYADMDAMMETALMQDAMMKFKSPLCRCCWATACACLSLSMLSRLNWKPQRHHLIFRQN